MDKVLVTGASGFIGLHCIAQLLQAGYQVRGSLRSRARESEIRNALSKVVNTENRLEICELDLLKDDGWNEAVSGCDYVMHVASPFRIANPKSENEMILPAVEGTKRVLHAADKASVKRVILTSSIVAMMSSLRRGCFGPNDWTDVNHPNLNTYIKSKTLAERAAWQLINENKSSTSMELTVIAPGGVFGPPLGSDTSGESLSILTKMLNGKIPFVPDAAFPMVDVRDVAKLHVKAMTQSNAAGERLIVAGTEPISFADAAKILLDAGYRGPSTKKAPSWLLKLMAIFDREAEGMLGLLGMNLTADNSKTRQIFNWEPIPFETSVIETAKAIKKIIATV